MPGGNRGARNVVQVDAPHRKNDLDGMSEHAARLGEHGRTERTCTRSRIRTRIRTRTRSRIDAEEEGEPTRRALPAHGAIDGSAEGRCEEEKKRKRTKNPQPETPHETREEGGFRPPPLFARR